MFSRFYAVALALVLALVLCQCAPPVAPSQGTRTITDTAGRTVRVPDKVAKLACLPGPSYEMVFAMGGKDQIGFVRPDHKSAYPLAKLTNPDLQKYSSVISQVGPKTSINIEEFINASPDTVIYYNIPEALQQFEAAGIPAVVVTWVSTPATSLEESIKEQRQKMGVVAELLGGEAPKRFEKWMKYYEEKVAFLRSRTANLPAEKRPRVYIGNSWGPNPLATWGKESGHDYTIELCGGRYVAKDIAAGQFPEVSMEQVIGWGPEVIFIDNHGREPEKVIENIKKDPSWAAVPAVKNGHIYRIPEGVFFLDKGTSAAVYLLWAAKKLHPDLFSDIDMAKELQYYFKEFYGYDLTKEQAEKILAGGPDDPGRWEGVKAQ